MNHDLNVRAIVALERIAAALTGAVAKTGHSPTDLQFRAVEALEHVADHFAPETKAREPEPPKPGEMPKELLDAINSARAAVGIAPLDPLGAEVAQPVAAAPVPAPAPATPVAAAPPAFGATSPLATSAGAPPVERRTQAPTTVGFQAPKIDAKLPQSAADLGHMAPPTAAVPANGAKPQQ